MTFVHSFDIKVHFWLFKTSQKTNVVVELHLGLKRGTPLTACSVVESQLGLERLRVQCAALGRRPQNRAKGAVPRTGTHKSEMCFGLGLLFPACLAWPGWGFFPGHGSLALFPGPCVFVSAFSFSFCFFSLTAGVTFQLPEGGTPGKSLGHRPKNLSRAPTQGPAFQVPPYVRRLRGTLTRRDFVLRRACFGLSLPLCHFIIAYVRLVPSGRTMGTRDEAQTQTDHTGVTMCWCCFTRVPKASIIPGSGGLHISRCIAGQHSRVFLPEPGCGGSHLLTAVIPSGVVLLRETGVDAT